MVIYVCSPLRATPERSMAQHIEDAKMFMLEVLERGHCPFVPHLLFTQVLNDDVPEHRELGRAAALQAIGACDEVWVFGPRISEGMNAEIRLARIRQTPVRWFPGGSMAGTEIAIDWILERDAAGRVVSDGAPSVPTGRPD